MSKAQRSISEARGGDFSEIASAVKSNFSSALRPRNDPCWNTENLYIEGGNLDVLKVLRENNIVMRDASAANDNVLDNFEQIFRLYSPDTTCKVL